MGCILGKRAAGDGRERSSTSDRHVKGEEEPPSHAITTAAVNCARARKEGSRRERERIHQAGDNPPPPQLGRRKPKPNPNHIPVLRTQQGWPAWLSAVAGDAIEGWTPRRADSFEKLDKIGQGTYSNVYKARDLISGKIVALKKVRFDNLEPESVKFMAREILVLRRLDHPNVVKLEGLVTSRMSCSLYLVFEYMDHDLAGLAACPGVKFTEPQVKCYVKQLLSGLEHCHNQGVLHRDIKGANLLLDNEGILKIADFGLATFYDLDHRQPMTSRVVTLWYRPPELLLGATYYGVGVDLWSAGCILAELLTGKPIMPGRTEVEQLHKIFKLCGSPSEEYWKKSKLPHATIFKPQQPYRRCIAETFKDFPPCALSLIETLLSVNPDERGTATAALNSDFFTTEPYACEPSSLPKYPPTKELDMKLRDEAARRQQGLSGKANAADGTKRVRVRDRSGQAVPAPEANAELQVNLDRHRLITQANAKSKSEKFPPPHQDGAVGYPLDKSHDGPISFLTHTSFASSVFDPKAAGIPFSGPLRKPVVAGVPFFYIALLSAVTSLPISNFPSYTDPLSFDFQRRRLITQANDKSKSEKFPPPHQDGAVVYPLDKSLDGPISFLAHSSFASSVSDPEAAGIPFSGPLRKPVVGGVPFGRKANKEPQKAPSRMFMRAFRSSTGLSMDLGKKGKEQVSEVFGDGK